MNKKIYLTLMTLILSSCTLAPGMYMNTSSWLSNEQVYIGDIKKNVEIIDKKLIDKLRYTYVEDLHEDLLDFSPDDYKIGVGDVISIIVFGQPDLLPTYGNAFRNPLIERQVRDDGSIFYPYAGVIPVEGLTREEIRLKVTYLLSETFNDPQVDVSIITYTSKKIVLSGAFLKLGPVYLNAVPLSLSEGVSLGNPIRAQADLTKVKLTRDGKTYFINYEHLSRNSANYLQNIYLKSDDVVHVPYRDEKKIHIVGEARSPKSIELYRRTMSLSDALSRAGGVSSTTGSGDLVYIIRSGKNEDESRIFKADLRSPTGMIVASQFQLEEQDIVFIGPANIARWNRVIAQLFPFASFLNAVDNISSKDTN